MLRFHQIINGLRRQVRRARAERRQAPAMRPLAPAGTFAVEALEQRVMASVVPGVITLSEHAEIVPNAGINPGDNAYRLLSQGALPYFGANPVGFSSSLEWTPQTPFKFGQLVNLSASYKGEVGTFGGGGPRFSFFFDWNNNGALDDVEENGGNHLFTIWGNDALGFRDVPSYTDYQDTGNFITNTTRNWDIGQLSTGIYIYRTYGDALAQISDHPGTPTIGDLINDLNVLRIDITLDGGWSQTNPATTPPLTQQLLIDNIQITAVVPDGPPVGTLTVSPLVQTRPGNITLTANGIVDPGGYSITDVEFYRDTNANGSLDLGPGGDALLGTGVQNGGDWSWTGSTLGFDAGTNRYFARAKNSADAWGNAVSATSLVVNVAPALATFTDSPDPVILGNDITLAATGSDIDGAIAAVGFYRDANGNRAFNAGVDTFLGSGVWNGSAWTLNVSTAGLPLGSTAYFARAQDNDGAWSASRTTYNLVNLAPIVSSLAASPDPVHKGDLLTLTADGVSDPNGTVASVAFYRDSNNSGAYDAADVRVATDSVGSNGWSWTGSTSSLPLGSNLFFAVARDNNSSYSAPTSAAVWVNNKPTVGAMTVAPNPVILGANITLTAKTVADTDGSVGLVEFYRDANNDSKIDPLVDQFLASAAGPDGLGNWVGVASTAGMPLGSNRFLARAQDNQGAWSAARAASITINVPPTLASLSATPNPVPKGDQLTLTALGASDSAPGVVASVEFYRDSNNSGAYEATDSRIGIDATPADGFVLNYLTTSLTQGTTVRFFARAKDNNSAFSPAVTTTVAIAAPYASSVTVRALGDQGWNSTLTLNGGSVSFVTGPSTPPTGTGSLRLNTPLSPDKATLAKGGYFGPIADFAASYTWLRTNTGGVAAPALKIGIDTSDANPGSFTYDKVLVYEPYHQHATLDNTWTTESTDQTTGVWWLVDHTAGTLNQTKKLTLAAWLADAGVGAKLSLGTIVDLQLGAGSGNAGLDGYVDSLTYTARAWAGGPIRTTLVNFES